MSDCCIVEFVEPKENIMDPNLKEVVVTNLDNYAMPIIRYRIGDFAVPAFGICDCGRKLPMIKRIEGRSEDIIKTSDGKRWPSTILDFLLKELAFKKGSIAQYKVIQNKLDNLEFQLVPGETYSFTSEAFLRDKCLKYFGKIMDIKINLVDHIPREKSGKLRDFVSTI